jgi:hypothetical protein
VPPVRAQGIRAQTGMRCWISAARRIASIRSILQGSALWHTPDPAGTKIRVIRGAEPRRSSRVASPVRTQGIRAQTGTRCWISAARRTASIRSVFQGSALWRAPDSAAAKNQFSGGAEPRRSFRVASPVRAQGIASKPVRLLCPSGAGFCRGLPYGTLLIQPARRSGCAESRRSFRVASPVRVQEIVAQTGALVVSKRRGVLQGSALWHTADQAGTKIRVSGGAEPRRSFRVASPVRAQGIRAQIGTLVVSKRRGVLPGSVLWRTPDPAGTNIWVSGDARSGTQSVLFVTQAARRAPEHGLAKFQVNGGRKAHGDPFA